MRTRCVETSQVLPGECLSLTIDQAATDARNGAWGRRQCRDPLARAGFASLPSLRLDIRDFVDVALLVVRRPFTNLPPVLEGAGAHLRPIDAEPLPVAHVDAVHLLAFGPDRAVLVVLNIRRLTRQLLWHEQFGRGDQNGR